MSGMARELKETLSDRIAGILWIAVKTAVVAIVILLLLRVFPIQVDIRQADYSWTVRVDQGRR